MPGPLARFPIKHAIERVIGETQSIPRAFVLPKRGESIVDSIKAFEQLPLEPTGPFAKFDASSGTVQININHPYYVNYSDVPGIEAFAAAEILLEAYLYESSLAPNEIRDVLEKRDQLLRALVREKPRSVLLIAQQIRDSGGSESEMEKACHRAFRALGFEVQPLGGSGKPDGLATAILAVRYGKKGTGDVEKRSYKVSYDAKSTGHEKIKSADIRMSTVARHRDDYEAEYAAVIGPEFETAEKGEESKATKEARQEDVTLIRGHDLADLVELSGVKPLSLTKVEELFKLCRSPEESQEWVNNFRIEPGAIPDLRRILDRIYQLQKENPTDPPSFGAVKHNSKIGEPLDAPEWQIKEWLTALSRLLPDLIYVYEDRVEINQKPDVIETHFENSLKQIEGKPPPRRHVS